MVRTKGHAPPPPPPPTRRLKKKLGSSLSVLACFDDLVRNGAILTDGSAETEFLKFVKGAEDWRRRWALAEVECQRLQVELNNSVKELGAKDLKIKQARILVENETKRRNWAENERDALRKQLEQLKEILFSDGINNETREKIRNLEQRSHFSKNNLFSVKSPMHHSPMGLNPVVEESADSILDVSELSFDETREESRINQRYNKRRSRSIGNALDGERLVATTTVSVVNGQAHAESVIETASNNNKDEMLLDKVEEKAKKSRRSRESRRVTYNEQPMEQEFEPSAPPADVVEDDHCWANAHVLSPLSTGSPFNGSPFTPSNPVKRTFSNAGSSIHPQRAHFLVRKKLFKEEDCGPCGGKVKMGRSRYKCRDCGATAHSDCKDAIPLPCIPSVHTPVGNKLGNYISDYTPLIAPMVPTVVIHCVREIENRGMSELGLYRVPGTEKESQELLDRFMRNKGAPNLNKYEISTIASCVKKFLRSLKEPLIPQSLWRQFVDASENPDTTDAESATIQAISELPQPNRDTMAYMVLHLQKVADSAECKMGVDNLARVFGPTIVGYSSNNDANAVLSETLLLQSVMATLLNISSDYWTTFVHVNNENDPFVAPYTPDRVAGSGFLHQTPIGRGGSCGPSERKSKKLRSLQKKSLYFQSPMMLD